MEKKPHIVALVPLRGGSKSILNKNIKELAGKPLAFWTLAAAAHSKYIDEVWVSTEDKTIKNIVESLDLGIKVIDRPQELAQDTSSTESVMLHFAKNVPFDILVTLQATSPLTSTESIDEAVESFRAGNYDSLVTGTRIKRFFWNDDNTPLNYSPSRRPMRQEWKGTLMENGAFYLTTRALLEREKCRLGGKIHVFEMPVETEAELDEPDDWEKVAKLLKKRKN